MGNLIISAVLLFAVGGATAYIYRAKKRGQACIGCPYAKECAKKSCQTQNK